MTDLLLNFSNTLLPFCDNAENILEYRDHLTLDGNAYSDLQNHLSNLFEFLSKNNINGSLTVRVNGEVTDSDELASTIKDSIPLEKWQVLLHKEGMEWFHDKERDVWTIWFLTQIGFDKWVSDQDAFNRASSVFHEHKATRILVNGLTRSFGGPLLAVDNLAANSIPDNWPFEYVGPDKDSIKLQVHLLAHGSIFLNPAPFLLTWGDVDSDIAAPFRVLSGRSIAACLTQEFYGNERVVLKGARRLEIPLATNDDSPLTSSQLNALWEAVKWIYEERPEVRAGLVADRLSLDLLNGQSLVLGASRYIHDALMQSKEQYKFVIQDRKDSYAKELRDLQKDVQAQAGLFSEKVRSIMNSLLRDVLAALLLISLGLFSRVGRSQEVLSSNEADLLFKALAVYLIVSLMLQLFVHLRDLYLSRRELSYWVNTTRTQLGVADIEKHLSEPLTARRHSFYGMMIILALIYFALAYATWNFQFLLRMFGILD